jgi:hypothetical protein
VISRMWFYLELWLRVYFSNPPYTIRQHSIVLGETDLFSDFDLGFSSLTKFIYLLVITAAFDYIWAREIFSFWGIYDLCIVEIVMCVNPWLAYIFQNYILQILCLTFCVIYSLLFLYDTKYFICEICLQLSLSHPISCI